MGLFDEIRDVFDKTVVGQVAGGSNPINNTSTGQIAQGNIPTITGQAVQGVFGQAAQGQQNQQMTLDEINAEIAQLESQIGQGAPIPGQEMQGPGPGGYAAPSVPELPGAEMLQNPLLRAIQDDVADRLMANRAARGKLGSGGTALALQSALAPTALNLGITQQAREQAQQQQNIDNLFRLFGMGTNTAAGQGQAGLSASSGISQALQAGGLSQAQGAINQGNVLGAGIGALGQIAGGYFGRPQTPAPTNTFAQGLYGASYLPTVQ